MSEMIQSNITINEGNMRGSDFKVAIVAAKFNYQITSALVEGAIATLVSHGLASDQIEVFWVPGAFEIPLTCQRVLRSRKVDGVIALGAVIKGDTAHFDFVAGECASGVNRVMLTENKPVAFGVLTTDTVEQALNRAGLKLGNKGAEAAVSLLELLQLYRQAAL